MMHKKNTKDQSSSHTSSSILPKKEDTKKALPKLSQTGLPPISSPQQKFNRATLGQKKQVGSKQVETAPEQPQKTSFQDLRPFSEQNTIEDISGQVLRRPLVKKARMRSLGHAQVQEPLVPPIKQKSGYVQKLKDKVTIELYSSKTSQQEKKFQNPVITMVKQQLWHIQDYGIQEEDESIIKDDINVTRNSEVSLLTKTNRLTEMKQASSHSSSNSAKNALYQISGSEKQSYSQSSSLSKSLSYKLNKITLKIYQYDEEIKIPEEDLLVFQQIWKKKEWQQGEFLGAGSFGQVFQAQDSNTGQIFALKKLDIKKHFDERDIELLHNELILMRQLKHKHIINYLGHEQNDNFLFIYLEYMSQGSLKSILGQFGPLDESAIKTYSSQVLEALDYLHSNKVIHRDIKGSNVLVDSNGIVKVADFGCSCKMEKTMTLFRSQDKNAIGDLKGSIPWMPPEVIVQTKYGTSADIWSFGCTVLEMATGTVPWSECDFDNPVAAILKIGLEDEIPMIPTSLSQNLQEFIKLCLQRDPTLRPTAQQLLTHSFLTK